MFPEEKKVCLWETRGTGDNYRLISTSSRRAKRGRKMGIYYKKAVIYYKKTCDGILQSCVIDCRRIYKISNKVIKFITEAMKSEK